MTAESLRMPIERLVDEPYATIICYPKPSRVELQKRLKELGKLGISAIEFSGKKQVLNLHVLGKGCVGLVLKAHRANGEAVALKVRRVDADRTMMRHEAEMLKVANSVYVGPKLLDVSKNFLVMQFVEGDLLPTWLEKCISKTRLKKVLRSILEQCWRLDKVGLDHGELSHAPKHIIVNSQDKPFILDFETASLNRKPANVTSIAQFLFISGSVAEKISRRLGEKDRNAIIGVLRRYKADGNRQNFEEILKVCEV
ncbi:MAG: serine/threonine protein kinase [Candidatus Bathyarchaeota archaeon]|nr:serine/threonine protein kinase [Candidatus Bathyarchaeota archaeon]